MITMTEKTFNIPLRKAFLRGPFTTRTNKAVREVKRFMKRHMKSDNIKIGKALNEELWKNGIKNPPHHVKVTAIKDKDNVLVEKFGVKIEIEKPKKKKDADNTPVGTIKQALEERKEKKEAKKASITKEKIENKDAKSETDDTKTVKKETKKEE